MAYGDTINDLSVKLGDSALGLALVVHVDKAATWGAIKADTETETIAYSHETLIVTMAMKLRMR